MKKILITFLSLILANELISQEKGDKKTNSEKTGEKIGQGLGDLVKGLGEGVDKSMTKVNVITNDQLLSFFELGRTAKTKDSGVAIVSIYVICNKDVESKIVLKAFDSDKKEMGRKTIDVIMKESETDFLNFKFDSKTPIDLAEYFTLEIKH